MMQNLAKEGALWLSGDPPSCPGLDFFLSQLLGVAQQRVNEWARSLAVQRRVRLDHQPHSIRLN